MFGFELVGAFVAEGLSNAEAAEVLDVDPGAASKRYGRAIGRLSAELRKMGVQSM